MSAIDNIVTAIESGVHDTELGDLLEKIEAAVENRKPAAIRAALQDGKYVHVIVNDKVSPKYLIGTTGVVVDVIDTKRKYKVEALVDIGHRNGRIARKTRMPFSIIDIVSISDTAPLEVREVEPA